MSSSSFFESPNTTQYYFLIGIAVIVVIILLYYMYSPSSTMYSKGIYQTAGQGADILTDQDYMDGRMLTARQGTGNQRLDQQLMDWFSNVPTMLGFRKGRQGFTPINSGGKGTGSVIGDQALQSSTPVIAMNAPPGIYNPHGTTPTPTGLIINNVLSDAIAAAGAGQMAAYTSTGMLGEEEEISPIPSDYTQEQAENLQTYIENVSMGSGTSLPNQPPTIDQTNSVFNPAADISALASLPVAGESQYDVPTKPVAYSSDKNSSLVAIKPMSASSFSSPNKSSFVGSGGYSSTAEFSPGQLKISARVDVDSFLAKSIGKSQQAAQTDYVAQNRLLYPTAPAISVETVKPAVNNAGLLHFQVWQPAVEGQWSNPNIITDVPNMANAI